MKLHKHHLSTRKRSLRSEKRAAKFFGGKVQPASGSINRFDLKGDVKSAEFLVEDKMTANQSYSIKVVTWRKLSNQAWRNNRKPCLRIEFADGPVLYVVDERTMDSLKHDT